jgi:protein unc-13
VEVLDLTEKQARILDNILEILKGFFHGRGGDGLKMGFFKKSQELARLRSALELYRCSSDTLISTFIHSERKQDVYAQNNPVGYVNLQASLFAPGSGDNRLTVKIVSATDLHWPVKGQLHGILKFLCSILSHIHCFSVYVFGVCVSNKVCLGGFRPYVELNVLGPNLHAQKRRQTTSNRTGSFSPTYNEIFHFNLGGEAESYELHLVVKDRCYTRSDRVVGVAVLQLRELIEMGSRWLHLPLGRAVLISEMGRAIVGILYGRSQDEIVKDFVHIKYTTRAPELDI